MKESVIGIRTHILEGATIRRSVLLDADYYESDDVAPARGDSPRLGIGRNVVLDRVIVDKNARIGDGCRLVNEQRLDHADGDGYYIRNGVIIVPKDGVVKPGRLCRVGSSPAANIHMTDTSTDSGAAQEVFRIHPRWMTAYCPTCDRCYCGTHWVVHGADGWCAIGHHRQMPVD